MKSFADKHKDSYMLRLSVKMLVGAINKDNAIVRRKLFLLNIDLQIIDVHQCQY